MTSSAYDELVIRSLQGSVFARSWWLDAVVGEGSWRAHVLEEGGEAMAAWPTVVRSTSLGDLHLGAPLTPFLGPLFAPEDNTVRRYARQEKALELLLDQIEPCAHVEARCNPAFDYWTPLSWAGFAQTTRYTWRLLDLRDPGAVFARARENVRREVRKAEKRGLTVAAGSLAELQGVHSVTAARQRGPGGIAELHGILSRIDAAAAARDARAILLARDPDGRVHAGGYFVHDDRFAYYLLGGSDPELRTSGSATLLIWRAIERAAELGLGFDFEGSMVRPVERFFRAFGGLPVPYSVVRKTPSRGVRLTRALKRAGRSVL